MRGELEGASFSRALAYPPKLLRTLRERGTLQIPPNPTISPKPSPNHEPQPGSAPEPPKTPKNLQNTAFWGPKSL